MSGFCSTLGNFHSAETDEERGNVLFSLFKQLYDEWSENDCGPCSYEQIVANLYRLSVVEGWEGGAFFFRLFTGASIKEEESTTYVDAHTYTVQEIDDENIHGYVDFLGDILTGQAPMPNSAPASNHVVALRDAITSGRVRTGADFRALLDTRGFGGSNWQGIDDGWGLNPGLADALVTFLRAGAAPRQ